MSDLGSPVTSCRSCSSADLVPVIDLGVTPIANALLDPDETNVPEPTYPLRVVFCAECSLVQLGYALPADAIFDEEYPYYSSFSDALCRHAAAHVDALVEQRQLGPGSFAVEIASNDGYLLKSFAPHGVRTLGVDPSPGPGRAAIDAGVDTIIDFFGTELGKRIRVEHGPADVIIANNVMAHIPDLNDFVGGFAALLADEGVLTVENPYVRTMVENVEFDTIYHEHYYYYSCTAVDLLMRRHGLHLNDVAYFPNLHGGTCRWYIERVSRRTERCAEYLRREQDDGLTTAAYYEQFATRASECRDALRATLLDLKASGRRVASYGAAAKGATLLNSAAIGNDLIDFVVDRNTHKQGKLMPGCRLPIRPVEALIEDRPDEVVLLAWNFAKEIVDQQREYLDGGGRFIVPVPLPHHVDEP